MTSAIATFLRRTIYFLLLTLAVLVILGSIILSQLDLDDYRHELEDELSSALEQPVKIGHSKLTFNKGIALRFRNLQIGPENAPLADIPALTTTLKIRPLLDGQILLDRVEINNPKLQFWFPVLNRPERGTTHQLTDKLGIRILTIRDASLKLHYRQKSGSRELLSLKNLQTELRGWQPNKTAQLLISGELQQPGSPADFHFDINLPSSTIPAIWRSEEFNYQLHINHLATGFKKSAEPKLPSNVNLQVAIQGIPANGAKVDAVLKNSVGQKQLLSLSGQWKSTPKQETFTKLTGEFLALPLTGDFALLRQTEQQFLAGHLEAIPLSLTPQLLALWQVPEAEKLREGTLERLTLSIKKKWPRTQRLPGIPRVDAELTISDFEWDDNNLSRIQDFSAELSLKNQQLLIHDGLLVSGQHPIFFSGHVDKLFNSPQLNLAVELQAELDELGKQISIPENLSMSGPLPATLSLTGPFQQPKFRLQADLGKADLAWGQLLELPEKHNLGNGLLLEGEISSRQLQLNRLELQLPGTTITGAGYVSHTPGSDFFQLDFDPIRLEQLQPLSPLLKKLRLQGIMQPTLARDETGLKSSLQLTDVGVHLKQIVGDLNGTNGQIDIDPQGLRFDNLQASFGQSAFILNGQIDNWNQPQLDLWLQGAHVRARDLIFANQQLLFHNIDGQLQFNRQGIKFNQIKAQLGQETEVLVNGSLDSFSAPQVTLDIEAEKANIDQVIGLFIGPSKRPKNKTPHAYRPVIITARAKQGRIGELPFTEAEGLIKDQNGVFTIYPLNFMSGSGFCQARVEFDRTREDAVLKVSGHAEGVDATILHQDLFKERGLINGPLRGDFYLEGPLKDNRFWHNAIGGIHLQVKNGTLRKFRGLARVFSLLNVSQLFAGKLPDMDKEGMPFNLLEGTVRIAGGRAHTEDMRINSEAMNLSMVGSQSLIDGSLDYHMGVMPLRTVDKVITAIPIAGWVLAGEDKALLTAHFKIEGPNDAPTVTAVPINTVSDTVFGIVKRTLGLPGKLVKDIGSIFKSKPKKKAEESTD